MNEVARQTLRRIVTEQGPAIGEDPRRVESFLRDLCGECRAEIFLLTTAAQAGVPQDLLSSSEGLHDVASGLIDNLGVPRSRCYCGNPLTPPVAVRTAPHYTGPSWPTFEPTAVSVIAASLKPIQVLTLIDTATGKLFGRPIGTLGQSDVDPPKGGTVFAPSPGRTTTTSAVPSTSTTTTAPPATTLPLAPAEAPTEAPTLPPPTQAPAPGVYRLSAINVTRTYTGPPGSPGSGAIQPGTVTVPLSTTQFQVGWNFTWDDAGGFHFNGTKGTNTVLGTVNFSQVPTTVTDGSAAAFAASMHGDWSTTGYGIDRDHTISLTGGTGDASKDAGDAATGDFHGDISSSGSATASASQNQVDLQVTASIDFGSDNTGQMLIDFIYSPA